MSNYAACTTGYLLAVAPAWLQGNCNTLRERRRLWWWIFVIHIIWCLSTHGCCSIHTYSSFSLVSEKKTCCCPEAKWSSGKKYFHFFPPDRRVDWFHYHHHLPSVEAKRNRSTNDVGPYPWKVRWPLQSFYIVTRNHRHLNESLILVDILVCFLGLKLWSRH